MLVVFFGGPARRRVALSYTDVHLSVPEINKQKILRRAHRPEPNAKFAYTTLSGLISPPPLTLIWASKHISLSCVPTRRLARFFSSIIVHDELHIVVSAQKPIALTPSLSLCRFEKKMRKSKPPSPIQVR